MAMTRSGPWTGHDAATLLHELEVHHAELEVQNGELQSANDELRRSNAELVIACDRFRALYERAPVPYVTIDSERVIVDVNRRAELALDTPRDRLVGGTMDVFIDDAARIRFRGFVEAVFVEGHGRLGDVIVVRPGAEPVDALIEAVVVRESLVEPPHSILAIVDITARKLLETARRVAQDEVLAIVSHDLRGPINAIALACDALSGELEPDEHRECVAAIQRSSTRCERLIADLLGVAHIESGRLRLDVASFDLNGLVRHVCRQYGPAADAAGAKVTLALDAQPAPIVGDQDRLFQVVSNLLGNALVHARGAAVEVSVAARDGDVVIAVADDGPGISPAELPTVFEKYRQGTRRSGGAGLGLAIVKGLVEAHHGTASVTSRLGHGARFEVVLPRGQPSAATP